MNFNQQRQQLKQQQWQKGNFMGGPSGGMFNPQQQQIQASATPFVQSLAQGMEDTPFQKPNEPIDNHMMQQFANQQQFGQMPQERYGQFQPRKFGQGMPQQLGQISGVFANQQASDGAQQTVSTQPQDAGQSDQLRNQYLNRLMNDYQQKQQAPPIPNQQWQGLRDQMQAQQSGMNNQWSGNHQAANWQQQQRQIQTMPFRPQQGQPQIQQMPWKQQAQPKIQQMGQGFQQFQQNGKGGIFGQQTQPLPAALAPQAAEMQQSMDGAMNDFATRQKKYQMMLQQLRAMQGQQ